MVLFYFDYLIASGFRERINYKFLEVGHSFGAVDHDGALGLFRNAEHVETRMDTQTQLTTVPCFQN